jgi:hypothetical protein
MTQVAKFSLQNMCASQFHPINPKRAPISVLSLSHGRVMMKMNVIFCIYTKIWPKIIFILKYRVDLNNSTLNLQMK